MNNFGCFQLFWRDIFTILLAPGRSPSDFHFINQKYYIIISRAKACGGCTISISGIAITEIRNDVRGKRISRGYSLYVVNCLFLSRISLIVSNRVYITLNFLFNKSGKFLEYQNFSEIISNFCTKLPIFLPRQLWIINYYVKSS